MIAYNNVNKVIMVGNIGSEPELRHTKSGKPVCNLSIATNHLYTGPDGEKINQTHWHKIVVWGKRAENCYQYLKTGNRVYLEGSLIPTTWIDQEGNKRQATEIHVDDIRFLGTRKATNLKEAV